MCRCSDDPRAKETGGKVLDAGEAALIPDDVRAFVVRDLGSIWAIELLVLLRDTAERPWSAEELVRELRASGMVVGELLPRFKNLGLVESPGHGRWVWRPVTPELDRLSGGVAKAYATTPVALAKTIAQAKTQIHLLADAFKLKGD